MKKLIAILCALCMIATMVPFSVMAEDAATMTVYKSWDGSVQLNADNHGFIATNQVSGRTIVSDVNLGGNSGPYMQFSTLIDTVDKNEALIYTSKALPDNTPYTAFSINVYGKALQDMYSRYSSNVKPAITGNISGCLVEDRWNNVFVVWDSAAKEATLYVNGTEIRTVNFYDFVEGLNSDSVTATVNKNDNTWTWTNGTNSENGTFKLTDVRFRFVRNSTQSYTWNIDDIYIITSDTELTPAAYATVTSDDAVINDGSIVTKVNTNSAALSAEGAKIMVKRNDAWTESSVVTAGDEVVVITSTPYGNIYNTYAVTADTVDKFWDGSSSDTLKTNIGWSFPSSDVITWNGSVTDPLGGKVNDAYASITGVNNESVLFGAHTYSTRYFASSINVYGQNLIDIFSRLNSGAVKPSLVAEAKLGTNLQSLLTADRWNNVFFVFDSQTKDMKTYVNGELKAAVNLYDTLESSLFNGTVDRTAGTATIDGVGTINADFMNLKSDIRFRLVTSAVNYVDDLAFMYTDYEPTPAAYATVTSDNAAVIDGSIVINTGDTAALSADGAEIMVKHNDAWSENSEVAAGDEVVVVTSTPYGNIYNTYTVTKLVCNKFWDGSSSDALKSNIGWTESNLTAEFKADGLGGNMGTYAAYTGSANEAVLLGGNSYSTRYFAMSINAYGKSIRDIFPRLNDGAIKPSLVANAKFGGNLKGRLVDNKWNNVFFVFDSQTKDMKTYINGELKVNVNLYDILEGSVYNGTVDRTAGTAVVNNGTQDVTINENLMNLKTDIRIVLNNGSVSYIDDLAFMYTDYELTPAAYVTTITSSDAEQVGNFIVLNDGVETAEIAANGATVCVNDGTAWSATATVAVDNDVVIITQTPYGNIYAPTYLSVLQACEGTLKDTDGVEGAFKWVIDPAAGSLTVSKVDGVGNGEIAAFEDHLPDNEAEKIAPWYYVTMKSLITKVDIGEGITHLPAQILRQNGAYAKVTLPSTLSSTASFVFNAAKISELYIKEGAAFTGGSMINGNSTVNKIIFPSTMTPDKGIVRDLSFGTYGGFASKTLEVVAPYNSPAYLWAQERYAEAVAAKEETKGEETKYWGIQAANFTVTESYNITACENGVVTIANNTGYPVDSAYVIIGYYDGEGDLIAAELSGKQTLAEATNTVTLDTVADAASTKVFVWNNMTDLKPLANIYE